eukprot:jgi/Psemu1/318414/estExt_fgenesh1_pm.C_730015
MPEGTSVVPIFHTCTFLSSLTLSTSTSTSSSSDQGEKNEDLCGMYLAPSTIPGAGMGVFAGHRDIPKGEHLLTNDGDLVVPVYEMTRNVGHTKYSFLWEEYTWKASSYGGMNEEVDNVAHVKACSTGLGAAINCILPLVNVVDDYDNRKVGLSGIQIRVDTDTDTDTVKNNSSNIKNNNTDALFASLSSPGAGAFSPFHNRRWKAKRYIPAGMELYGNYGEGYFKSRSSYNKVPLRKNYRAVDKLLKKYQEITGSSSSSSSSSTMPPEQRKDLLIYLQSLSAIWKDSRNMHAIPQTDPKGDHEVVDWLLRQSGGSGMIHYNSSIRDLDWLHEHGRCMDNIRDGISRIPHAGRGAFARRNIPRGSVVAPAPLIQIPDRTVFTIYGAKSKATQEEGEIEIEIEIVSDHDKPIHHQLLLNYCFGHGESSLLLCPYGLMTSHINHDATNPNTKIVWAADDHMTHPEWRKQPIKRWGTKEKAGLSFDFVALRDIEKDEEITIDYGSEWEEAWQSHLQAYYGSEETSEASRPARTKQQLTKHHVPAFELNELVDLKLQTVGEGDYENQGLRLFCHRPYLEWHGANIDILDDGGETFVVRFPGTKNHTKTIKRIDYVDWDNFEVYPCRIRKRYSIDDDDDRGGIKEGNSDSYRYLVEIFERSDEIQPLQASDAEEIDKRETTTQDFVWAVLFDVPGDAFYFEDQKNGRHHHQQWSFRHEMRIPDEIFPDVWRNRKD